MGSLSIIPGERTDSNVLLNSEISKFIMMEEQKDESIKETILKYFERFKEWLKPNKEDSLIVQSLKMVYKVLAVLLLIVFSPVIIVILIFVFFAAL